MKIKLLLLITLTFFMNSYAQIEFEEQIIIDQTTSTNGANSLYSVDIDGDGDKDVLSTSYWDNKIAWYENLDGAGNFGIQQVISVYADGASSVFAIDLDGDGDVDVLSASVSDDKIVWYENLDGQGDFGFQQYISSTANGANTVFAIDIDGDGDVDVLSASHSDNKIAWYENLDGQADFSTEQIITTNAVWAKAVYATDIDGDGDIDVLSASSDDNKFAWYENMDGQGSFGAQQIIGVNTNDARDIYSEDIDGDGDMDVVSVYSNSIVWYENLDGQGNFDAQKIIDDNVINLRSTYTVDVDGDGDLDVVSAAKNAVWYENMDGQGTFGAQQIISSHIFGSDFVFADDLDNDGDFDVLTVSKNALAWHENSNGQGDFGLEQNITTYVSYPLSVYAVDVDGDGYNDVLSASLSDNTIAWYKNLDGQGNFDLQQSVTTIAEGAASVFAADIDGDGDMDILSASAYGNKVAWYENVDGTGNFSLEKIITTNTLGAYSVFAIDIDGDGDMDVLSASSNDNKIAWYENTNGLGSFDTQQIITTNVTEALSVFAIDIDGDGDADVLSASQQDNKIAWYENTDGLGAFGAQQIISELADGASSVFAADLDGDGDIDVLSASYEKIAWYENTDGLGDFDIEDVITTNIVGGRSVYAGDMDGDGDLDVLSTSSGDSKLAWYENVGGQGLFGSQQIISDNLDGATSVIAVDLDNDNVLDVVSSFGNDDTIAWYKNIGENANEINGVIQIDLETNGCDSNDLPMPNLLVVTDNGIDSYATFTVGNGVYQLFTNEGEFTTTISSELPNYYTSNPASYSTTFVGVGNTEVANFCIEPIGDINDLNVSVYPLNDARPGFEATYQIVYRNVGTTIITDALELTFDDTKISFLEASEGPIMQSSNSLTFDFYSLLPFETKTINVVFEVFTPPTTEIGDILPFTAVISPVTGDYTEDDNTFDFDQTVIGAYDPNDIQVLEGDEIYESETDNYLHYIIRFQNVGTASAINVRVTNELDPNLDWNTLQIENISHTNRVEIRDGNQVEFIFDNINLPDSTSNEEASHGYIQYKIKPKNIVSLGDSMSNNADIFFDFNPAVATNIVTTTVVDNLSVNDHSILKTTIYPNPSNGLLKIKSNNPITKLIIYNQLGQVVLEESNENGIHSINLDNLSQGIYFIKLSDTDFNNVIKRLIKK